MTFLNGRSYEIKYIVLLVRSRFLKFWNQNIFQGCIEGEVGRVEFLSFDNYG